MELAELTGTLAEMTADDLRIVAKSLAVRHQSAGDEVDSWHAVVHIDEVLRRTGRSRQAAHAAYAAAQAVLAAAASSSMVLPDPEVTRIARAAALVARGIVAGTEADADVRWLLLQWPGLIAA
jgi:hypothetical protein